MQVSSSKGHDYSKKCKHMTTETEVPFLFMRIICCAAPFETLHGVVQHHEFMPQNKFQNYPIWKMPHYHHSLLGG
jgi:hypothetical protein